MENINDVYGCDPCPYWKGVEHGKVGDNTPFETDDCLWTLHESWCHAKPPYIK